ncbi:prepilin-type N-terminal cleavage/methylation domain-containing protein [bacterium]|nr:prepilin-type N-terminal cleavage/methylation domain-containing protein [bacterium]
MKTTKTQRRGFSLVELSISCFLLGILLVVLATALHDSQNLWRQTTGNSDSRLQLRRAQASLERDMQFASSSFGITPVGPQQGPGFTGDAFWFLSAEVGTSGQLQRKFNGAPVYLRNVLYYVAMPQGDPCPGGLGPNSYDDRCPHKVLIRKTIDFGAPSSNESSEETLMTPAQVNAYLTRPNGMSVASMNSEPGVKLVSMAARELLWFRVRSNPAPLQFEVRAVNLPRTRKEVSTGTTALYDSPLTSEIRLTLIPPNP